MAQAFVVAAPGADDSSVAVKMGGVEQKFNHPVLSLMHTTRQIAQVPPISPT